MQPYRETHAKLIKIHKGKAENQLIQIEKLIR